MIWYQKCKFRNHLPLFFSEVLQPFELSAIDDLYDPYLINNTDSSDLILVSQPLTLENWNSWKRAILMALGGRNKLGFVDGTIPPPDPKDPLHCAWLRNNNIVASWLMNSISKEVVAECHLFLKCSNNIEGS